MNRFCFAILLLGLALLASSSANLEAAEPLVFKKEIKLSEDARKLIGKNKLALKGVLFVENEALVALFSFNTQILETSPNCVGLNRLDLKTNKSELVKMGSANYSFPQMHLVEDTIWVNPLAEAFKRQDLTLCTPQLESGDQKLTFLRKDRMRIGGRASEMKLTGEKGQVTIRTIDKKETKTHKFDIKLTLKDSELTYRGCADALSGSYVFSESPKKIQKNSTHWLVRPYIDKDWVTEFELPKFVYPVRVAEINEKKYILTGGDGNAHILDLETKKITTISIEFESTASSLLLTKDKRFAFKSSWDKDEEKNLVIVDLEANKIIFKHLIKEVGYHALSLSPDEKLLAVTGSPDVIHLYEVNLPAKK